MPETSVASLTDHQRQCLEHIHAAGQISLTLKAYAEQHQISLSNLNSGKTTLRKKGLLPECESGFAMVQIQSPVPMADKVLYFSYI